MRLYALVLLLVPIAAGLTLLLRNFGLPHTPAPFLAAVLLAAWQGGVGPASVTLLLSALLFNVYFLHTPPRLALTAQALPFLVNFVLFGMLVLWLNSVWQRSQRGLQRPRDDLEVRVLERTAELERVNRALRAEMEERSRAEEQLRRSEWYLAEAQKLSHIGSWARSPISSETMHLSRELHHIFGFDPDKGMVSRDAARERIHPADLAAFDDAMNKAIAAGSDFRVNHRLVMPDGSTKYIQTVGHPVLSAAGQVVEVVGVVMDVTRRKRASRALRRAREQALSTRTTAVLEERTRLAREVHDTLLQGFTGVSLKLLAVTNRLGGPPGDVQELREVLALAQRILEDARRAVWDMRPAALGQADLPSALAVTTRDIIAGTPIVLEWQVDGTPYPLEPVAEGTILRVAQEAVTNVVKHAAASRLHVSLRYESSGVRLLVRDDGRGFPCDPLVRAYAGHWGLLGMQERATLGRGRLGIRSTVGEGTEIVLSIAATKSPAT